MVVFKLYFDKDLEEVWLNKMSLRGWAFTNFCLGVYSFEKCEPGEFSYQIDLLNNISGDKSDFVSFMEDSGVKVISQWYRWVYLQKKASDGPFEMYTDTESKISQYRRIKNFFIPVFILELICTFIEVWSATETNSIFVWGLAILIGSICLAFLRVIWKCKWKIEQLQNYEI